MLWLLVGVRVLGRLLVSLLLGGHAGGGGEHGLAAGALHEDGVLEAELEDDVGERFDLLADERAVAAEGVRERQQLVHQALVLAEGVDAEVLGPVGDGAELSEQPSDAVVQGHLCGGVLVVIALRWKNVPVVEGDRCVCERLHELAGGDAHVHAVVHNTRALVEVLALGVARDDSQLGPRAAYRPAAELLDLVLGAVHSLDLEQRGQNLADVPGLQLEGLGAQHRVLEEGDEAAVDVPAVHDLLGVVLGVHEAELLADLVERGGAARAVVLDHAQRHEVDELLVGGLEHAGVVARVLVEPEVLHDVAERLRGLLADEHLAAGAPRGAAVHVVALDVVAERLPRDVEEVRDGAERRRRGVAAREVLEVALVEAVGNVNDLPALVPPLLLREKRILRDALVVQVPAVAQYLRVRHQHLAVPERPGYLLNKWSICIIAFTHNCGYSLFVPF
ncbi:hypothetical protein DAKH74_045990 [Maudiozyma humilis]|uniref:Secreted protein n=1 Tax=Maudiozyma humilis TaxID=51915 RepID=A0AAV5S361_MAUHU|nr:hypothetical protein DAKH74_045990 [Kazachstania humilis]